MRESKRQHARGDTSASLVLSATAGAFAHVRALSALCASARIWTLCERAQEDRVLAENRRGRCL